MKDFHGVQSHVSRCAVRSAAEDGPGHFCRTDTPVLAVIRRGFRTVERRTGEPMGKGHDGFRCIVADQADCTAETVRIPQLQDALCAIDDQRGLLFIDAFAIEVQCGDSAFSKSRDPA